MQAILADTEFLAQNAIMDYSLLTCIDDSTAELVVGIIGKLVRGGKYVWLVKQQATSFSSSRRLLIVIVPRRVFVYSKRDF